MINWIRRKEPDRPLIRLNFHTLGWKIGQEVLVDIEDDCNLYFRDKFGDRAVIEKDQEGYLFTYIRKGNEDK